VASLHKTLAGSLRRWLLLVMATVALVLLVASANVANLLLARASSRQRELAVRAAMGAPLGRLVRMTLTESRLVLAMAGATTGAADHLVGSAAARPLLADRMPHVAEIGIDWSVFAFNAALATVTGLVCGLASLSAIRRLDLVAAFNEGGTAAMSGRSRVRQALLSAEAGFTFRARAGGPAGGTDVPQPRDERAWLRRTQRV
jgi:ABC-type antimicrobial peptide transport system permease subunit